VPSRVANDDANAVGELRARYPEAARLADGAEGGSFVAREHGGARVVCKPIDASALVSVRHAFGVLRSASSPHLPAPRELWIAPSGRAWLVTDWVDGTPLVAGPASLEHVLGEALGIARALATIHAAGTHHGDVSLANVIRTPTHGCVLVDLAQLGRLGTGSPGFIAPEVLAGSGGAAADRFALGCIIIARLTGELPLRRPHDVVGLDAARLRSRLDRVRGWTDAPPAVRELVLALLDPDPARRIADDDAIIHRLEQLHLVARGGGPSAAPLELPARWPYRGISLDDVVRSLADAAPARLVAIVGPAHSGRTRIVEEVVQRLQSGADVVARLGDDGGTAWISTWLALPAGHVLGWRGAVALPNGTAVQQAATLGAAARLADGSAVVAVSAELGDALERVPGVKVVRTRAWSVEDLEAVLAPVIAIDRAAWISTLVALTGGWSGRVVRALAACRQHGLARPEQLALAPELVADDVVQRHAEVGDAEAHAIMSAWWGEPAAVLADVAVHLHDGVRPFGSAVLAARTQLGARVGARALALAARHREAGTPISLSLAIDADLPDDVELATLRDEPDPASLSAAALVAWVEARGAISPAACTAAAARALLGLGMPTRALALTQTSAAGVVALEGARALQRLGRAGDALARLDVCDPADGFATGLRVRLLADLGRVDDALAAASAFTTDVGPGAASVRLWAGYARVLRGQRDAAIAALEASARALGSADDRQSAGIRARVAQLLGNLAHDGGELLTAASWWSSAAAGFTRAGEPLGGLSLRGSLAGLAIATFAGEDGIEHGRAAVRGLLAREQHDALATAAQNLAQLLARHGEREELDALVQTVATALGEWASPAARARAQRIAAEAAWLGAICRPRPGSSNEWHTARHELDRAARMLGAADLHAEASEAHVRAATCARRLGRIDLATVDLAAAQLEATRAGDDDPWRIAIEQAWMSVARRDRDRLQRWCDGEQLDRVAGWVKRGQLERAWALTRAVWGAASVRLGIDHPLRHRAAAAVVQMQETIMDKTPNPDRAAVRGALWADGERDALRDLLGDLEPGAAPRPVAPPPTAAHASGEGRTERLLRLHRRLAREDRLEPLLEQVIDAVMELTRAERGAVVVLGTERREVTRELGGAGQGVQFSQSVIERVLESGEPVLSVDAAADDRFDGSRSISHLNLRSVLAVPMRFRGELLGAIYVDHRLRRGNFDDGDLAHVEEFAELAALAVAHARALDEVRRQAQRLETQHAQLAEMFAAREAEVVGLRARVADTEQPGERHGIVGATPTMQRVYKLVDRLADTDVPVVVYGESGTGKELVARAIHQGGSRRTGPFVAENCGAIPETLLESVLFGHAKGSFTGADRTRIGLFEAAQGGTIFLDEVGEMSPGMQTKLLRVLQEGEVRRVGENVSRAIDVRVIAASNLDLDVLVEQGKFRRDLYYRIHVVRIELPPLRERQADIATLVQHFLVRRGATVRVLPATMRALQGYAWPGNVRELENEVQRWIALVDGPVRPEDLSPGIRGADPAVDPDDLRIRPRVERLERDLITRALERARGNQTRAADLLGLSRFGLQKKLRKQEQPDAGDDE
jgi:transcriptional regulator with GAF, ATPase, and Fis domain